MLFLGILALCCVYSAYHTAIYVSLYLYLFSVMYIIFYRCHNILQEY